MHMSGSAMRSLPQLCVGLSVGMQQSVVWVAAFVCMCLLTHWWHLVAESASTELLGWNVQIDERGEPCS